ncbi:MAG: PAS domain S-box protein, partial [Chitinophagaceae bacterium]
MNDPSYGEIRRALRGETVFIPATAEREKYFETYLIPIKNQRGDVISLLWLAHDRRAEMQLQAEQQKAQQELKEEHRRLKEAQAIGQVGSFEWNAETDTIYWSNEMYRIHGLEPNGEIITLDQVMSFLPPDELHEIREKLLRLREEPGILSLHHRIIRADGEERFVVRNIQSFADESGSVTHLSGTLHNITEQKTAEQELLRLKDELTSQAIRKYEELFNSIDQGFCTIDVAFNESGAPVDYKFVEVSPSFENQTGIVNGAGRWMRDIAPDQDEFWFETYGHVALTGESCRFEHFSRPLGRWWSVYAFKIGAPDQRRIGVLFNDITERKQNEKCQAFRLGLSDALRPLTNAVAIQKTVTAMAMEYFGADRCYYAEVEDNTAIIRRDASRPDLPSVSGVYPLAQFPLFQKAVHAGEPTIIENIPATTLIDENLKEQCIQLQILSYICVPVIKNGELSGIFFLTQTESRAWTTAELEMAEEIAEQTWSAVARARAEERLRKSEERFRSLVTATSDVFYKMSGDWTVMYRLEGRDLLVNTDAPNDAWIKTYIPES